jgi:hypothetical protein
MGFLTPEELALTKSTSITIVSVSGKLESVLDIRERSNPTPFVNLVKGFRLSKSLVRQARKVRERLRLVRTARELGDALEKRDWRNWPMIYDVPATCQVFGSLVMNAGIEGIRYDSSITGRECIAIFPQNSLNSSSFVKLNDPVPTKMVQTRADSSNFRNIV